MTVNERQDECRGNIGAHFLFVLMCPTCPQLAHFRWVPAGLESAAAAAGDVGESGGSAAPSSCIPFCLSRAILRSLFRSSRLSSASSLQTISRSA